MIPLCSPQLRFGRFAAELGQALRSVFEGAHLVLGPEVERFEHAFADYLGVRHCVGVNSGTDALVLALRALDIGPGDEVVTVSMSFTATAMAILHVGARPRFVDVDRAARSIDLAQVEAAITPRTAAILPVHLHGLPVDMPRLVSIARRHRLALVEDCAQAHGARVGDRCAGSFGDLAAFSFYPTKNLGCAGDGGAVVTQDPALASRVRALRTYGWFDERRISAALGCNSRLDEIQAAVLNVLLPHLDQGNRERAVLARRYRRLLVDEDIDLPIEDGGAVHHQFAIAVPRRDALRSYLRQCAGIETGVHYPVPLHRQPLFERYADSPLPVTEELARTMVSLPIQPEVAEKHIEHIARSVRAGVAECRVS